MKYTVLTRSADTSQNEFFAATLVDPPVHPSCDSSQKTTHSSRHSLWLAAGLVFILLAIIYFRIAGKLVTDWYNIPDYSHGFLVPLFAIFVMWDNRTVIANTPIKQSWAGLSLVVIGLMTVIFGVYGAELFLSRISFLILTSGLVWTFFGSAMLKALRFPLLILLLAIPFPDIVFNQITFPLQLLASETATGVLRLVGVPVLHEGNIIELPVMKLEVAEACSGIRSLMSLFTLAVFYGYFLERTALRRVILALASIPIAVVANSARIVGTGLCVQYWDPDKALGFFHEFSGWVMFVISLVCLYLLHRIMLLVVPPAAREKKTT